MLYCCLERQDQKRGSSASPCLHEEEEPQPGVMVGQGAHEAHMVPGLWHEGYLARGLTITRSMLPHHQALFCCSHINRPEGTAATFKSHLASKSLWLPFYSASGACCCATLPLPATRMMPVPWGHSCHSHCCKHTSSDGNSLLLQENHHLLPFFGIFSFTSWSMVP